MEILLTEQFEQAYEKLTQAERKSVYKAIGLLESNPKHPGLHVRRLQGSQHFWEARASRRLRMTFEMGSEIITMRNVGEHDRTLRKP